MVVRIGDKVFLHICPNSKGVCHVEDRVAKYGYLTRSKRRQMEAIDDLHESSHSATINEYAASTATTRNKPIPAMNLIQMAYLSDFLI